MGVLEKEQVADGEWRRRVDEALMEHGDKLVEHEERLERGSVKFAEAEIEREEFRRALDENTALTRKTAGDVGKLLEIFRAVQGFVKVSGWLGVAMKWLAILLICTGVLWWTFKTGELPKPPKEPF